MNKKNLLVIFTLTIVVALATAKKFEENIHYKKLFSGQAQVERLSRFEKHRRQTAAKYVRPLRIVFDYSNFKFDNQTTAAYLRNVFGNKFFSSMSLINNIPLVTILTFIFLKKLNRH